MRNSVICYLVTYERGILYSFDRSFLKFDSFRSSHYCIIRQQSLVEDIKKRPLRNPTNQFQHYKESWELIKPVLQGITDL